MALALALPVQLWTPLIVIFPSRVTSPLKASNGASKDSAQDVSVTFIEIPISVGSQCSVICHAPLTSGQLLPALLLPALLLPALPLPPLLSLGEEELPHALHTAQHRATANRFRIIRG